MSILHACATHLPDVLFLDLNMPLKNGFECLQELKSEPALKNIPVIIFSTTAKDNAIDETYRDGAQLYIRKPHDFRQLRELNEKILSVNWGNNWKLLPLERYAHLNGLMKNFFV